jgi:uncharacterized protein YbjT (DUF2867 family)
MIVIAGATGNIGSKLTGTLLNRGEAVRILSRSAERQASLVARGAEGAVGDLGDASFVERSFTGADAVFVMIPPNYRVEDFRAYQKRLGENIAQAISRTGVRYVVNLSSQGADLPRGTGPIVGLHDQESRLNGLKDVNVLHLRPTYFMENLLVNIELIRNKGIMGSAVKGDIPFAMIATEDIAASAAERLMKRDFTGKSVLDLLGPRDVSLAEAAAVIGKKLGRPDLKYVEFPYKDAEKAMVEMGVSRDLSRQYIEMSKALNDGIYAVGRERTRENTTPTTIEEFAGLFAEIFKGTAKAA